MEDDLDKRFNRQGNFKHPPIDAKRQVRLLWLQQNQTGDDICCSFCVISLTMIQHTRYKALSYTWGNADRAEDVEEIKVDEQPFFVRRNLFRFLETAARNEEYGPFFVDAICINQLDYDERQFQVREMARVFRNAREVIAWLGTPDTGHMDIVQALDKAKSKDCATWTRSQWEGLRYLSYNKYWTRIWVVQEVLLASNLAIWCGTFKFPLALFGRGCNAAPWKKTKFDANGRPSTVGSNSSRVQTPAEAIITHRRRYFAQPLEDPVTEATMVGTLEEMTSRLTKPSTIIRSYHSQLPDLIHQMVRKFGKLECSDPRDKLYGLLGILSEHSHAKVQPDYKADVGHAYYQALKVGMEEMWPAREAGMSPQWLEDIEGACVGYYCDARDTFDLDDEVSMPIFRQVLKELGFRARIQDATFEAQLQRQYGWCDLEIRHYKSFRRMIIDAETEETEATQGFISSFHMLQRRIPQRLLKSFNNIRYQRNAGWRKLKNSDASSTNV